MYTQSGRRANASGQPVTARATLAWPNHPRAVGAADQIADGGHGLRASSLFGRQIRGVSEAAAGRDRPAGSARAALIAGFRLVRDTVLPHAWSVFHCVATPRIPVHHAHEPPIGGKSPSYFLFKSLTQSFPLEWRDVLRHQRLRKLHTAHSVPLLPLRGVTACSDAS